MSVLNAVQMEAAIKIGGTSQERTDAAKALTKTCLMSSFSPPTIPMCITHSIFLKSTSLTFIWVYSPMFKNVPFYPDILFYSLCHNHGQLGVLVSTSWILGYWSQSEQRELGNDAQPQHIGRLTGSDLASTFNHFKCENVKLPKHKLHNNYLLLCSLFSYKLLPPNDFKV